ncbi:hypothetical protein GCM10009802_41090 [Streptomyces synnematoformans]|uniref:Uncharacterized protein n=1 Tax=Streptomyces synnematoformans TaxID=415721 RepID=A0ABP5KL17_9ACTN
MVPSQVAGAASASYRVSAAAAEATVGLVRSPAPTDTAASPAQNSDARRLDERMRDPPRL